MTEKKKRIILALANEFIRTECTIRDLEKRTGISKSTIWKLLTDDLSVVSKDKAERVKEILKKNKEEAHIRGGKATKLKRENLKKEQRGG